MEVWLCDSEHGQFRPAHRQLTAQGRHWDLAIHEREGHVVGEPGDRCGGRTRVQGNRVDPDITWLISTQTTSRARAGKARNQDRDRRRACRWPMAEGS